MLHDKNREHIDIFFVYGMAAISFFVCLMLLHIQRTKVQSLGLSNAQEVIRAVSDAPFDVHSFNGVTIQGKAYVIYDIVGDTVVASKNATSTLPLASLTKVMTAVSALTHGTKKDLLLVDQTVTHKKSYDLGLRNKQVWNLSELLKYTLIFSSNDAAEIIADRFGGNDLFVKQMNNDAKAFGLSMRFTHPAGLDLYGKVGGEGTALDVARLFSRARGMFPEILDATTKKRATVSTLSEKIIGVPNTNQDIENISGAEASKTGFTDLAGGNLAVVVDISIGRPVVIVVLGSTKEGRFSDVETLYKALRKSLTHKDL